MSFMTFSPPAAAGTQTMEVTGTTQAITVNTQYYANNPTQKITFTLPASASPGDKIFIRGIGAGLWRLSQNSGQTIHGATDTTTGTNGYIEAQAPTDCATLECRAGSGGNDWAIINQRGTLTSM